MEDYLLGICPTIDQSNSANNVITPLDTKTKTLENSSKLQIEANFDVIADNSFQNISENELFYKVNNKIKTNNIFVAKKLRGKEKKRKANKYTHTALNLDNRKDKAGRMFTDATYTYLKRYEVRGFKCKKKNFVKLYQEYKINILDLKIQNFFSYVNQNELKEIKEKDKFLKHFLEIPFEEAYTSYLNNLFEVKIENEIFILKNKISFEKQLKKKKNNKKKKISDEEYNLLKEAGEDLINLIKKNGK